MADVAAVGYSQGSSGSPLTIIDESVLDSPIGNYVRTAQLWSDKDATGTLIDTLTFTGSELEVSKVITSDRYWSVKLIHTGSPAIAPAIANFATDQFEYNLLNDILGNGCGCSKANKENVRYGYMFMALIPRAVLSGNSARTNNYINSAKAWLSK